MVFRLLQWLDDVLGRLVYRLFGCITALMSVLALWVIWHSLVNGEGPRAWLSVAMFSAGAALAIWTTKYCFSRQRKLGDLASTLDDVVDV